MAAAFPTLVQVVLDTTDTRALAEFYRQLLGYVYRRGDEPPHRPGQPDPNGQDWLVIQHQSGAPRIAFQQVSELAKSTWPKHDVPQQLHLDFSVPTMDAFHDQHQRALELGATLIYDRSNDPQEPLHVYADPSGHPFCIFVVSG